MIVIFAGVVLNHLQRFLKVFRFDEVDRVPDYEFCYWKETITRWHKEGLPRYVEDRNEMNAYLGLEGWPPGEQLPIRNGLWPTLPSRTIKIEGDRATIDDGMGGICYQTISTSSLPHYLRHPLKDKEDWEKLQSFFDPDTPGRFPLNWDEIAETYRDRDYPLGIRVGSLYGWLRNWMGVKRISICFYQDPDWICEMMDTLVNLWIKLIRKALGTVKVDYSQWWEDMCYSRGPLLSVNHFEEYMVPRYRKVTNVLKEYGVELNLLDSDGDITALVPGWLEAGINVMYPLEARFTDMYRLREDFGHNVLLIGNYDKRVLFHGVDLSSMQKEFGRLTPMLEDGGYIPMIDHCVPPEVSFRTFKAYLEKKRAWLRQAS